MRVTHAYVKCMTLESTVKQLQPPAHSRPKPVLWCPVKTKSQATGLGCCLALLSTVFSMTEHNSDSDHIDIKRLTMSGEKVICQLFHCGIYCMTATHAMEWKT